MHIGKEILIAMWELHKRKYHHNNQSCPRTHIERMWKLVVQTCGKGKQKLVLEFTVPLPPNIRSTVILVVQPDLIEGAIDGTITLLQRACIVAYYIHVHVYVCAKSNKYHMST